MTLTEISNYDRDFLTPHQICGALGASPTTLYAQLKADPSALGFPVIRMGTRCKIPRLPFLAAMGYPAKEAR